MKEALTVHFFLVLACSSFTQLKFLHPLGPAQLGIILCSQVTNPLRPPTFKTLTQSSPSDDLTQLLGESQLFVLIHIKVWKTLAAKLSPLAGHLSLKEEVCQPMFLMVGHWV